MPTARLASLRSSDAQRRHVPTGHPKPRGKASAKCYWDLQPGQEAGTCRRYNDTNAVYDPKPRRPLNVRALLPCLRYAEATRASGRRENLARLMKEALRRRKQRCTCAPIRPGLTFCLKRLSHP